MGSSNDDKPLRYACDRCHSQKLRCPRSVEAANPDEPCSRCRKAGVSCVVSLRGKVGRPSKSATKKKTARSPPAPRETPEADFPSYDVNSVLSGDGDDSASWLSSRDPLMDMFEMGSGSGSATSTTSPQTLAEDLKPSVTSQPSGTGPFPDMSMGSGSVQMPYEPFVMDFEADADYPTFLLPNLGDLSAGGLDPEKAFSPAQFGGFADMKTDIPPLPADMDMNSSKATSEIDPTTLDPRMSFSSKAKSPGDIFTSEDFEPVPEFSSTISYQKLSDLNLRILQCSSAAQSGVSINSAQLLKDVTGFSGELIDTARQSMPHFLGSTRTPSRSSTASQMSSKDSDDEMSVDTAPSHSTWGSVKPGYGPQSTSNSVPESAVIFLLLGCYTQILHLFEITTNCLWSQHCEPGQIAPEDSTGTIGSLLEASIAIHTVTYLLSRLHQALAVPEGGATSDASESQTWKRSFVGGKELEDGLLGRAFGEIREREQWLMQRTKHLQQQINKCHI